MKLISYMYFNKDKRIEKDEIIVKNIEELNRFLNFQEKKLIKIIKAKNCRKISKKDENNFFFNIGKLLKAQIPLKKSLELQIENSKNKNLVSFCRRVVWKLDLGEEIFSILKDEKVLTSSEELVAYIFENSGDLSEGFLKINEFRRKGKKLKDEIFAALAYPIFIVVISTVIILLMLIFIVPNFLEMYSTMSIELPKITQIIIGITKVLTGNWGLSILIFFMLIFICKFSIRKNILLRFPVIGGWIIKRYTTEVLESINLLIDSGFPLDKTVDVVLEGIKERSIKSRFIILKEVKKGYSLSQTLEKAQLLSGIEINIIKVGEESGELSKMLKEVVDLKKELMEKELKVSLKLLEPLLLLIVGVIIGFFIVGLYLPILNISETII